MSEPVLTPSSEGTVISNCQGYLEVLWKMNVPVGLFYLRLGRALHGATLPSSIARMEMGRCYANAGELAIQSPELVYMEGFAHGPVPVPVHHAWLVSPTGEVIDPTWGESPQAQYYGVAYTTEFLLAQVEKQGCWGIGAEHLPQAILEQHPRNYLHPAWAPPAEAQDEVFRYIAERAPAPRKKA